MVIMIQPNKVRAIRKRQGLSGLDVAYRAKIAPGILSNIENGKIICYPGWRKRIAAALAVPEHELFPEVSNNGNKENQTR
jgi:transcriptional regulator with XRE-family HTH domain